MDFKHQAGDEGASTYIPSRFSNDTFFPRLPPRRASVLSGHSRIESYPFDVTELVQREIEKKRIREEIITAEIFRRRKLEEEVRRELQMEKEIAMMRGQRAPLLWSDMRVPLLHGRDGFGVEDMMALMSRPKMGILGGMPFQRQPEVERLKLLGRQEAKILPFRHQPEASGPIIEPLPEHSSGQVVLLAKPAKSNLAGTKRKAEAQAISEVDGFPSVNPSKRSHKQWSCAICQVRATSERGLNDHLQGRKHKAKEASLKKNKAAGKHTGNSFPMLGKVEKSTEHAVTFGNIIPTERKSPDVNGEVMKDEVQITKDLKEEDGESMEDEMQKTVGLKMQKFKYCCQLCGVGTFSEEVMEAHLKGRTHMAGLLRNGGAVIAIDTTPENVQEAEETATRGGKEDLLVNADALAESVAEGKEYSMDGAEEMKETAALEEKGDSFGDAVGAKETVEINAKEDSLGGAEEDEETAIKNGGNDSLRAEDKEAAIKKGRDDSLGNAEEAKETAINEEKEYLLGNVYGQVNG